MKKKQKKIKTKKRKQKKRKNKKYWQTPKKNQTDRLAVVGDLKTKLTKIIHTSFLM